MSHPTPRLHSAPPPAHLPTPLLLHPEGQAHLEKTSLQLAETSLSLEPVNSQVLKPSLQGRQPHLVPVSLMLVPVHRVEKPEVLVKQKIVLGTVLQLQVEVLVEICKVMELEPVVVGNPAGAPPEHTGCLELILKGRIMVEDQTRKTRMHKGHLLGISQDYLCLAPHITP